MSPLRPVHDLNVTEAIATSLLVYRTADAAFGDYMEGTAQAFIASLAAQTPAIKPITAEQLAYVLHDDAGHPLTGACDVCRRHAARIFGAFA